MDIAKEVSLQNLSQLEIDDWLFIEKYFYPLILKLFNWS